MKTSSSLFSPEIRRLICSATSNIPNHYRLRIGQSKIDNAGRGILVDNGDIPEGNLVCIYPGVYSPPIPVGAMAIETLSCIQGSNFPRKDTSYRKCNIYPHKLTINNTANFIFRTSYNTTVWTPLEWWLFRCAYLQR